MTLLRLKLSSKLNGLSLMIATGFMLSVGLFLAVDASAVEQNYPTGFSETKYAGGLGGPIAMEFMPDGRLLVTEQSGKLRIVKNGATLATPFVSIPVNSFAERGLLGVAVDPDFATNPYVYVYYTRAEEPIKNRVSRFTVSANNPDIADPASEQVLLDNIPADTGYHNGGSIHFAPDGKLFVTVGDSTRPTAYPQNLASLSGKVLRINKDGTPASDNPFVDRSDARPEVWAYGLRNPFSSAIDSATGDYFINDVGESTWEEINRGIPGANYGWPTCEGPCVNSEFTNPVHAYDHTEGKSVSGSAFYRGDLFPSEYDGDYFFADFADGFIKRLDSVTGNVSDFATGLPNPVDLEVGPDGGLYYASITTGAVYRIGHTNTPTPPDPDTPPSEDASKVTVLAAGTPSGEVYPTAELLVDDKVVATWENVRGNPDTREFEEFVYQSDKALTTDQITLQFANDASEDGEDRNLRVDKLLLDGIAYESESPQTRSTGTWTVDTGCAPGNKQSEWLHCGGAFTYGGISENQAPTGMISNPEVDTRYDAGNSISYEATANDREDGTLPPDAFSWTIAFHHDTHSHPFLGPLEEGRGGSFTVPQEGEVAANTWYRIHLTVTDSGGKQDKSFRDVYPNTADFTLATNLEGLSLALDGQPRTAPITQKGVVGFKRVISAPATQTLNGIDYEFVSWSDNGNREHTILTAANDTTYTANYREIESETETPDGSLVTVFAAGTPAGGIYPTAELLLDDQVVATWDNIRGNPDAREFMEFTYRSQTTLDTSRLSLRYANDAMINGQDRNLRIDKLTLDDKTYESESPQTHSTGTWASDTGCAPGNKQSEWLHCGGAFRYGERVVGTSIKVYAAGSEASNVYPELELSLNGEVLRTFSDIRGNPDAREFQEFIFSSSEAIPSASELKLQYTNDAIINGQDRNLRIDRVVVNDIVYQVENPSVYSTGTWAADTGCAPGNKQSEWLHCGGSFQLQL